MAVKRAFLIWLVIASIMSRSIGFPARPLDCDFDFEGSCPHWSTKNASSVSFEWRKWSGPTRSWATGPFSDHTTGTGNYLYVEASYPTQEGNKAWLLSDQIPATAGRCLAFWYHMYGASMGTLNVYIVDKDNKSTLAWSKSGDQGNQWNETKLMVESKIDYKLMFEAVRGANYQSDIALDDIGLTDGPCPPVDGHWGSWSSWGACSKTCNNGTRLRTRKCDDPIPANSGGPCPGDDDQKAACIIRRCSLGPLDCDFDFEGSCPHWSTKNASSVSFEWRKWSGPTRSWATGPFSDHTTGTGNYLYVEASYPTQEGNKAWLLSDQIPATAGRCLSFWYHMYGASMGTLNVYIVDKDDKSTLVWSKSGDQGNQWNETKLMVESKIDYKLMFEAVRGANYQSDIALDDIGLTDGPCLEEVGCFRDNLTDRAFPTMLKNLRGEIDWHHLEKIVQKCAMLTKENNYKIFAIQFYGECWSGDSSMVKYDRFGAADKSRCPSGVGAKNINAVYRLLS